MDIAEQEADAGMVEASRVAGAAFVEAEIEAPAVEK